MQKGRNYDNQNIGSASHYDSDVVFIRQFSMPVLQKTPKLKPRIIRPKPSLPSNPIASNKSVNAVGTLVPLDAAKLYQMEIVDCSNNGSANVYILDQSDFVPLLENSEGINGALVGGRKAVESTENVEEILVDRNQVQLLNEPNKQSETGRNYVCRTCLTLTDYEKCKKLFDSKDREESNKLREKLVYIAGEINYKASFNAAICQKCITLIEIAYSFKKQVREVENRIRKKLNENKGNSFVDLRCFLEGNGNANVTCLRKDTGRTKREGRIVSSQEVVVVDDDGKETKSDSVSHISSQSKFRNLEEYLITRGERLDRIRQHVKIYQQQAIAPAERFNGIVTVQNSPEIISLLNLEAVVEEDPETEAVAVPAGCDKSNEPGTNFEAHLAKRQERLKKFDYTNQFSNSNFRVLKNQKRPFNEEPTLTADNQQTEKAESPAYKFLLNTHQITKKKPEVPKTWDLFDEEHDKYFKNLVGEAGCFMMRKWSRFVKRYHGNRWHTDGPYLCHYCGFISPSRAKFSHHMGRHSFKKEMCSYCGKLVKGGRHLRYHVEAKHLPPSHECNQCGKKFHLSANLATHILRMHKGGSYTVQCQVCGKLLMNSTLKLHMARLHNQGGQRFTCDVCGKSWSCKYNFYKHRKKHIASERFNCSLCPKTFTRKQNLRNHVLQFHEGLPKLKCMICDKTIARKDSLKKHLRVRHNTIFMDGELTRRASKQGECNKSVTSSSVNEAELTIKEQTESEIACESILDELKSCDLC